MAARAGEISGEATDGRVRRTERSRKAILNAFYEIVGEGVLQPTSSQIAERAGVGIRSLFRHFSELDGLFSEMSKRVHDDYREYIEVKKVDGTLEERTKALVIARCEMFDRIAPYLRAASLSQLRSAWLLEEHHAADARMTRMAAAWVPEIDDAPEALRDAMYATISFDFWDRLRREQGLSSQRTQRAVELAMLSLIAQIAG